MNHQQEKNKTEKATGLGRKTREAIEMGNQMTTLSFRAGM